MTEDAGEQFFAKACREYNLPRCDEASQPKRWIQGNTKSGPVLEITTSCQYGKHGVEFRIWSLSKDNTQSWVRISHGSIKSVTDSHNNDTESPEDLPVEQASQLKIKDFAARSKAKAKPQRREPDYLQSIIPMNERKRIDIEPRDSSFSAYEISKKVINLLRHSQTVQREDDGATHFWRIKNYLQNQFPQVLYWSDDRWKVCLTAGGGAKRKYQYCTDISETIVYLRALQGYSGRNLTDPSLQDNLIIQSGFFQHIYHNGCAFFFLIFILSSAMDGYLEVSIQARDRQYSFCPLMPETKLIKILERLTSLFHVVHNTCIEHGRNIKMRYFGLILILQFKKRIDILSDSIECNHPSRNTSSLLYSKSCQIEDWRSLI